MRELLFFSIILFALFTTFKHKSKKIIESEKVFNQSSSKFNRFSVSFGTEVLLTDFPTTWSYPSVMEHIAIKSTKGKGYKRSLEIRTQKSNPYTHRRCSIV